MMTVLAESPEGTPVRLPTFRRGTPSAWECPAAASWHQRLTDRKGPNTEKNKGTRLSAALGAPLLTMMTSAFAQAPFTLEKRSVSRTAGRYGDPPLGAVIRTDERFNPIREFRKSSNRSRGG